MSLQIVCLVWSDLLFPRTRCSFSVSNFSTFSPLTCYKEVFSPLYPPPSLFLFTFSLPFSFCLHLHLPFSPSSPRQITRYRQQTVTQGRKIFSGGENCPELVAENTSKHSWGGEEREGRWGRRNFLSLSQREAGSTYRQIHNKTIYVFLFLLRSRKRVRSSLSTCLVSGDTGIYNPG